MSPFDFERAMTEETIAMTQKAVDRLGVVQQVVSRQLRQREAVHQLGLSVRQIKRLATRYREEGPSGLVSRRLGQRPVRRRSPGGAGTSPHPLSRLRPHPGLREAGRPPRAQALCRDAAQWMIAEGLWKPRARKSARIHQRPVSGRAGADRRLTP